MKVRVLAVIAALVILCGMAEAKTYKVGSYHWIGFSANDVASAKGFWKAQGLEIELISFTSERDACNALVNKRVDIAFLMIGTWVGFYMEDAPITIIAEVDWSHGSDKVIIKKGLEFDKLKGQPFGIYVEDPAVLFFLNQYLSEKKTKLSDIQIVSGLEVKDLADSFIFDRIKGVVLYDPQAIRAEREGKGEVVATTASYPGCVPEGAAVRTDSLQEIPQEVFVKFFKGWIEAAKWLNDPANWKEYSQILNTKTFEGETPYSDADLKSMYEGVRIHDVEKLRKRNKTGMYEWLKEARTMLKDNNRLKKDFEPEKIFDNRAIMEALR